MAERSLSSVQDHSQSNDWRKDPVLFVRDQLGVKTWRKQEEILNTIAEHNYVAVRSCNGSGKTFTAALATIWWLASHDEAVVITTAPTERQVKNLLWREIRDLHYKNEDLIGGSVCASKLELSPKRYAFGFATNTGDRFQGFHSPNALFIVDEAAGVPEFVFDAISGCMTTQNAKLLMIGNPTVLSGTFYHAFHKNRHLYETIHISAFDTPAFTGEIPPDEPFPQGALTKEWVERIAQERGEESAEYAFRVLGEFPRDAVDTLISLKNIEDAVDRVIEDDGANHEKVMGLDVARYGNDQTVAAIREGLDVVGIESLRKSDLMDTTGRVVEIARKHDVKTIYVDEVGVGAGILDRLKEIGTIKAIGINGGKAPYDKERHLNLRSQMFDALRERFQNGDISIPDDPELISQLASLTYEFTSLGQMKLESKQKIRQSGRASPDKADALALAFTAPLRKELRIWIGGTSDQQRLQPAHHRSSRASPIP